MKSLNRVSLIGNLGKDPVTKTTPNGNKVTNISIATTESYKDKSGNWQDTTDWHNVQGWSYISDKLEKLSKGDKVYIEGKSKTRSYEKNGETRYITEVLAKEVINLNQTKGTIDPPVNYESSDSGADDDVPF